MQFQADNTTSVGAQLRQLREAAGLSQMELGRRSGVNQATITRIEKGTIQQPTVASLTALAAGLDVDPAALLGGQSALPAIETYLRRRYQDLHEHQRQRLIGYLHALLDEPLEHRP